ncbi:MAG: hypothetical protein P8012_17890 [Desulfobacterales bacterium]
MLEQIKTAIEYHIKSFIPYPIVYHGTDINTDGFETFIRVTILGLGENTAIRKNQDIDSTITVDFQINSSAANSNTLFSALDAVNNAFMHKSVFVYQDGIQEPWGRLNAAKIDGRSLGRVGADWQYNVTVDLRVFK